MYRSLIQLRNVFYDRGWIQSLHAKVPIISIGNLSVGGTGKTPITIMIAQLMNELHLPVSLLSSGYGRKTKGEFFLLKEGRIQSDILPEFVGDEPYLHALTGLYHQVIVNKPKSASIHQFTTPVLIDDGFQHRAIARDIDIVLVNEHDLNDRVLPFGKLREPLTSLHRADIVVCTDHTPHSAFSSYMHEQALFLRTETIPLAPCLLSDFYLHTEYPFTQNIKESVMALAGIANPDRFLQTLLSNGFNISHHHWLKDHVTFTPTMVNKICQEAKLHHCNTIVITSKDAVKLHQYSSLFASHDITVYYLPIATVCIEGKLQLSERIQTICTSFFQST